MKLGVMQKNDEFSILVETDTEIVLAKSKNGIRELKVIPKKQIQLIDISKK